MTGLPTSGDKILVVFGGFIHYTKTKSIAFHPKHNMNMCVNILGG